MNRKIIVNHKEFKMEISMQSCRKVLSLHWTGTVAILRHI